MSRGAWIVGAVVALSLSCAAHRPESARAAADQLARSLSGRDLQGLLLALDAESFDHSGPASNRDTRRLVLDAAAERRAMAALLDHGLAEFNVLRTSAVGDELLVVFTLRALWPEPREKSERGEFKVEGHWKLSFVQRGGATVVSRIQEVTANTGDPAASATFVLYLFSDLYSSKRSARVRCGDGDSCWTQTLIDKKSGAPVATAKIRESLLASAGNGRTEPLYMFLSADFADSDGHKLANFAPPRAPRQD